MSNQSLENVGACTRQVVDFVHDLSFSDLPREVIEHTKLVLLDTIGALIAASNSKYDAGRKLTEFVRSLGGTQESTIIGQGFRSSCINAAIVNGTFGYYCDIEAHHPEAVVHPAATIVPTCLAVAEREKASGKELLIAFILGTEFDCRVSMALNPRVLYDQGFHPSSIAGTVGAALAAGRLFRLDKKQYPLSLGLSAQQTSGLLAWKEDFSENSRPFNHSIAARNGITSAYLAKLGFGAPPDIFEGRYNIFRAFAKWNLENIDVLTRELGKRYSIMELAFKQYSCCAFLHPGLDALIHILNENNLDGADIDHIVLRFPKNGTELIDGTDLRSHSAQYILPIGAHDREVLIDDILFDRRSEPAISRLVNATQVIGDEQLDAEFPEKYASIVEITTTAGKKFSKRVDYAAGTPENPFSADDIKSKFTRLVQPLADDSVSRQIVDFVDTIEHKEDISQLGEL
ncbi:MAG: MmgE/PrpD family protein, partial [Candidatus Hodarchaeota archaeon]